MVVRERESNGQRTKQDEAGRSRTEQDGVEVVEGLESNLPGCCVQSKPAASSCHDGDFAIQTEDLWKVIKLDVLFCLRHCEVRRGIMTEELGEGWGIYILET